jgi:uncharacterized protein YndB with AHSA1/START domain
MSERKTAHATFTIERIYPATPARVFRAWSDPAAKAQWFAGPKDWTQQRRDMDFRIGGREHLSGGPPGAAPHVFDAIYYDIVPNERIIYGYDMHIGETRISVSLATVELKSEGKATRLVFTEQAVFLDGFDDSGSRERGSGVLLDQLGTALARGG